MKGTRFPVDQRGLPLLIDPSIEDPWEFLDFDPATGNLNARFISDVESYSFKGEKTVEALHLDRREGLAAAYRKTYRRLCLIVAEWTNQQLADNYIEQLREKDDHGLLGWFFFGEGEAEPVFVAFRERYPDAWLACQQAYW